ncbi:conjugative transfer region protein TrbK [Mesorhizobium sp. NFR06]|uniref:putative entry exclusion protein TrbK-alt n=1 Tax=Mesorhizobium sp. NFR06 TaxID=1566290 RepID=UPI0008EBB3FD|nr:putative entry exclusion protein TrbK-alt [Mesorhizobium sp. NFR06]SFO00720.1 conjugative transfer region protein TrbK [Mesorhizobium sp. NFR06]
MDVRMLARLGAIAFVAVAITVTVIELSRKDEPSPLPSGSLRQPYRDPLREGQRWCQQLGLKAAEDSKCLRVWAETRDRFLGRAPDTSRSAEGR